MSKAKLARGKYYINKILFLTMADDRVGFVVLSETMTSDSIVYCIIKCVCVCEFV